MWVSSCSARKRCQVLVVHFCSVIHAPVHVLMCPCCLQTHFPPVQPCLGSVGMWVWSRSEPFLGPVGATLRMRDEREVWAPSLLILIKFIATSPDAWPITSGFIPLISDLGKLGLHAVGPILGGVLTGVGELDGHCLCQVCGLGCCLFADPGNPGKWDGRCQQQAWWAGKLGRALCDAEQGSNSLGNCTFSCRAPDSSINLC